MNCHRLPDGPGEPRRPEFGDSLLAQPPDTDAQQQRRQVRGKQLPPGRDVDVARAAGDFVLKALVEGGAQYVRHEVIPIMPDRLRLVPSTAA